MDRFNHQKPKNQKILKMTLFCLKINSLFSLKVKLVTQTNNKLDEGLRNLTFKSDDKLKK